MSDGKIIVRQVLGQTINLLEWQDSSSMTRLNVFRGWPTGRRIFPSFTKKTFYEPKSRAWQNNFCSCVCGSKNWAGPSTWWSRAFIRA